MPVSNGRDGAEGGKIRSSRLDVGGRAGGYQSECARLGPPDAAGDGAIDHAHAQFPKFGAQFRRNVGSRG